MKKIITSIILTLISVLPIYSLESIEKSVVRIIAINKDGCATGTGFIINSNGYILTNAHVVLEFNKEKKQYEHSKLYVLQRIGNNSYMYPASFIGEPSIEKDLAIIKVDKLRSTKPIAFSIDQTNSSDDVMAVGYPGLNDSPGALMHFLIHGLNLENEKLVDRLDEINNLGIYKIAEGFDEIATVSFQKGNIERIVLYRHWGLYRNAEVKIIQHNAAIRGGSSGGPLLNSKNEVIGVNTSGKSEDISSSLAMSSHIQELMNFLDLRNVKYTTSSIKDEGETSKQYSSISPRIIIISVLVVVIVFLLLVMLYYIVSSRKATNSSNSKNNSASSSTVNVNANGLKLEFESTSGKVYKFLVQPKVLKSNGNYIIVGRDSSFSDVCIDDISISRNQFGIKFSKGSLYIEDRSSSNGTYVDSSKLTPFKSVKIYDNSRIKIGNLTGTIKYL